MELKLKLNHIKFEDFRLFDKFELTFDEQLTVLIGENGGGKTAILEGIAKQLTFFTEYMRTGKLPPPKILYLNSDIRYRQQALVSIIKVSIQQNDEKWEKKSWMFDLAKKYIKPLTESNSLKIKWYDWMETIHHSVIGNIVPNASYTLPVIVYYPIARATNVNYPPSKDLSFINVYDDALNGKALNINWFLKWLIWKEDNRVTSNHVLMAVKSAILGLLNDGSEKVFTDLYTDRSRQENYRLIIQKGDINIDFDQLSSGEKSFFVLVGDLARRLAIANPKSDDPLRNGQGIVLIDEIDLHLHPSWQRKAIPKLKTIFPNIQWVISTHSPQVLMHLKRENVKWVRNGKLETSPFVEGRDANAISTDVFGLTKRLPDYEKILDEIYDLIDKGDEKKAKLAIESLKQKWGEADVDLHRAESFLEFCD
jgi:predicted ATP-binding protein involved in virulence